MDFLSKLDAFQAMFHRENGESNHVHRISLSSLVAPAVAFLRPKRIPISSSQTARDPQRLRVQLPRTLAHRSAVPRGHYERLHGADVMWQVNDHSSLRTILFVKFKFMSQLEGSSTQIVKEVKASTLKHNQDCSASRSSSPDMLPWCSCSNRTF
jgi:hypothetical protein